MKRNIKKLTALLLAVLMIAVLPSSVLADERNVCELKTLISKNDNISVINYAESISEKSVISKSDIEAMKEYSDVKIQDCGDGFALVTVDIKDPVSVSTYSDGRVAEDFTRLAYVVEKNNRSTHSGSISEEFDNSIVYMLLTINYTRLNVGLFDYYRMNSCVGKITSLDSSCRATKFTLKSALAGVYYVDEDERGSFPFDDRTVSYSNPSTGTSYSVGSPASYYFIPGNYADVAYVTGTLYYTRGTGSYSRAFTLHAPWVI